MQAVTPPCGFDAHAEAMECWSSSYQDRYWVPNTLAL
jgi:hypothetical protein